MFFKTKSKINSIEKTSKSIVLISEDADRTMCTFLGASNNLLLSEIDGSIFDRSKMIYIEGYLYDTNISKKTIVEICERTKSKNVLVCLSLSDIFCIERHRDDFLLLLKNHIDIVFCNEIELKSLFNLNFDQSFNALRHIVKQGAVTLGPKGSRVFYDNEVLEIPEEGVIDTTGAGDLFASGYLYGLSTNRSLYDCGMLGALSASEIISHVGAKPIKKLASLL